MSCNQCLLISHLSDSAIVIDKGAPLKATGAGSDKPELKRCVVALEQGTADVSVLKKLALLSRDHPARDDLTLSGLSMSMSFPASPTPMGNMPKLGLGESNIWTEEKLFDRLFSGLMEYLKQEKVLTFF